MASRNPLGDVTSFAFDIRREVRDKKALLPYRLKKTRLKVTKIFASD